MRVLARTGMIGAETVAKAPPDGNTIFLSGVSTFVLNPLVYSTVSYDTLRDFASLTLVAAMPQISSRIQRCR